MALLTYDFRVINENALAAVLASNERRVAQHNARISRMTGTPLSGRRTSSTTTRADDPTRAAMQLDRQRSAALMTLYRAEQREKLRAERAVQVEAMRGDRERAAAARALDRQRSAALLAQHRAAERASAAVVDGRREVARNVTGRIGRSVAGTVGGVGAMAVGALGIGGTIAAGSALQTQLAESAQASKLAIQAKRPELKGELLQQAQGVQGFTGAEALTALEGFVTKTGDLDAGRAALGDLSTLALATSADLGELGEAAGQAFNVIRDTVKDPAEQLKALREVMASLAAQGTLGAVEIRDMATELGGLGAATRIFKGGPVELLKTVGAMAQTAVARGGAASAAEATTSVVRFASDLTKPPAQKALEALGINAFADKGRTQLRAPQELMVEILEKTRGDLTKLNDIFGEYGVRALRGFSPLFTEAEARQKGSGGAAVLAEFNRFTGAASSPAQMAVLASARLSDDDIQIKEAQKAFNRAIGTELLPVVTRLIPEFTKLIPSLARAAELFAKFVEEAAKNPLGTLFKVIAAKLLLDLTMAGIGAAVRRGVESIFARIPVGGGAGVPVPAGAGGAVAGGGFLGRPTAAGVLGAVGIGAMVGAPVAEAIYASGVASIESGEASMKDSGQKLDMIRALSGASSRSEFEQGFEAIDAQREKVRELAKTSFFDDFMGLFGASNRDVEKKTAEGMLEEMVAAIKEAQVEQMKAATALNQAGEKLASANLNRGNTPAPPVP